MIYTGHGRWNKTTQKELTFHMQEISMSLAQWILTSGTMSL